MPEPKNPEQIRDMVLALKEVGWRIVDGADDYLTGEDKSPHVFLYRVVYALDDIAEYLGLDDDDENDSGIMDLALAKFAEVIGPGPVEEAATPATAGPPGQRPTRLPTAKAYSTARS